MHEYSLRVLIVWLSALLVSTAESRSEELHFQPEFRILSRRMSGEFERQAGLLVAWDASSIDTQRVLRAIVGGNTKIPVIVLVQDEFDLKAASTALRIEREANRSIRIVSASLNSPWARDYGPTIVRAESGTPLVIDAVYGAGERPNDDKIPFRIGQLCGYPTEFHGLCVDGGNLLSNGAGLAITTSRLLDENLLLGYTVDEMKQRIQGTYGLDQLAVLEPLFDEPTGHVDMFATFTGRNTVVVGSYPSDVDPVNAAILDRNAQRLRSLRTRVGPLNVVRLPMPTNQDGCFRTWTNVVFANGVLLVPSYPGLHPVGEETAIQTYRRLLPGWKIKTIDCSTVIRNNGALHCLTMNLAFLPSPSLWASDVLSRP